MSNAVWLVVPTAGRATLEPAIDSTGLPRDRCIVVATTDDVWHLAGVRTIHVRGPINIHRWWNEGLDHAAVLGARYVLVINDDVLMVPGTVDALLDSMRATGATLATPGSSGLRTDPDRDAPRTLLGSCWLIDLSHGLRPDEGYRWWFGDDDLDWRARRDHAGVVSVPCHFEHLHPNELTAASPELHALADADARRWNST